MLFRLSQMYVHINKHGGINKVAICFLLSNKLCPDHHGLQLKKKKNAFLLKDSDTLALNNSAVIHWDLDAV